MQTDAGRGYRIGLVVVLALGLAGTVVVGLEKVDNFLICNMPDNGSVVASSLCSVPGRFGSSAMQVNLPINATVGSIAIWGGFANGAKSGFEKVVPPGDVGNFTVNFLANMPDFDGDFPGMPFMPTLLAPANATLTGNMLLTPFGPVPEYMVHLDLPMVSFPAGPFWLEIFHSFLPAKGACAPSWHWATAAASNVTLNMAQSFTAPGMAWTPRNGTLAIKVLSATGACCTNGPGTQSACIETTRDDCESNHKLFTGEGTRCSPTLDCVMLVVEFDSVSVKATQEGVLLNWTTAAEVDTVGFRVLRETTGRVAKSIEIVSPLIPAVGAGLSGGSYSFLDNAREAFGADGYYIEDVDIYGRWTRHGPFAVERLREASRPVETRVAPRR